MTTASDAPKEEEGAQDPRLRIAQAVRGARGGAFRARAARRPPFPLPSPN